MKLFIAFVCAVSVFATSQAMASKARLTSFGQDKDGSQFIDDDRNYFLNPGHIGKVKNSAQFEWGATSVGTTAPASPKAEGGLVYSAQPFTYGVELGRIHRATESMLNSSSLATGSFFIPQNSIELLMGQGGALSWGGSIHYASSKSERGATANFPDSKASVLSLGGGVVADQFSAYAHFEALHKAETNDVGGAKEKYEGKFGAVAGGTFKLGDDVKIGAQIINRKFDFDNGAAVSGTYKTLRTEAHLYHRFPVEKFFLFGTVGIYRNENITEYSVVGTSTKTVTSLHLPTSFGVEVPATSWLNLRSAVKQAVLLEQEKTGDGTNDIETDNLDNTVVSAGASLLFGDMSIDATLEGADAGTGKINTSTLLANVGMKYSF